MFLNYWLLINLLIRAIVVDALVSGFTDNELQELSEKCNEDSEHHCSLLHYYNGITKLKVDRLVDQSVKTRLLRVDAVPPATLYSTLFEDYVVTNRYTRRLYPHSLHTLSLLCLLVGPLSPRWLLRPSLSLLWRPDWLSATPPETGRLTS